MLVVLLLTAVMIMLLETTGVEAWQPIMYIIVVESRFENMCVIKTRRSFGLKRTIIVVLFFPFKRLSALRYITLLVDMNFRSESYSSSRHNFML